MNARHHAIQTAVGRELRKIERPKDTLGKELPVSEYFGSLTFGLDDLKEKLSKESFAALLTTVEKGGSLAKEIGDEVARVVKDWAVANGATHFCHWFQPMTGLTAEKHDSFVDTHTSDMGQTGVIEKFSGSSLIQSEPDASSFPSGGMRSTFEARGYTAWDPKSPLFLIESVNGTTLCIPSVFLSYTGHALDVKTPLLRSVEALSTSASKFLKLLGDVDVKTVGSTLGCEQEYFLVDQAYYSLRPDLVMTGRTLVGRSSSRHQQFEDHYFGSIPNRALSFMNELEQEMNKLGVPVKTRHNEVAPSQFEVAPVFEVASVSADHNALKMDMLRKIALKHNMVCLLHEKPFALINGNGKHNNWSMSTNRGDNLLDPGKTPHQNLRFLAVLSAVIKAVHDHADVLRTGIASAGNDHRLGANEAPPAIISVFLGETLSKILDKIEIGEMVEAKPEESVISLGVSQIPHVSKDNTDRNRTSPFAFTGNKFEFRAVGSTANVAVPISFLNAAVADAFDQLAARLEEKLGDSKERDQAVLELVREVVKETKAIRFEGDNYSDAWEKEAEKRGLPNLKKTPDALNVLRDPKATSFLQERNVLSAEEIESRYNVMTERYINQIDMEAITMMEMIDTYVLPAAEKELLLRSDTVTKMRAAGTSSKIGEKKSLERLMAIEELYGNLVSSREKLSSERDRVAGLGDEAAKAKDYAYTILPLMEEARVLADEIEGQVTDEFWSLPKYREMLFLN